MYNTYQLYNHSKDKCCHKIFMILDMYTQFLQHRSLNQ